MRKFTTHIYTKANYLLNRGRMALSNQRGDFYISDAVKIIIAVVLGALLLAALTLIFNDTEICSRKGACGSARPPLPTMPDRRSFQPTPKRL